MLYTWKALEKKGGKEASWLVGLQKLSLSDWTKLSLPPIHHSSAHGQLIGTIHTSKYPQVYLDFDSQILSPFQSYIEGWVILNANINYV